MKSIFSAVVIIVIAISSGFAQIPTGYYDNAAGLEGESLRDALRDIIKSGHTQNSYKSAKDLHNDFYKTDRKSNGKVWDMYSDIPGSTPPYEFSFTSGDQCGNYSKEGDCYNKEHSFPKSWFNEAQPAYADLFHLVPTDGYVNGIRNNFPFGENNGESYTSQNGSKKGACTYPGYGGICFEPIDDYKGDFARNYFYMATRYKDNFSSWADNTDMITGNNLSSWAINMLLEWHELDPVSTKEINRNNAVHDIQGNRNPYIDYPEWVECVWGSCDALQFTSSPVTDARENEAYSYSITYAVDIDDELLECTTKPSWLTFTPNAAGNSATLAGTPTVGSAGNASVVLTLTENGITATQNFTIVVVAASAPEFIFDKDFQDVSLTSGGWTAQNVTGNDHVWYVDTYDGSSYAKMSGHSYADFNNEDWLISPAVNMDDYEDEVFSFSSALKYATSISPTVKYSTNYNGTSLPSTATWTNIPVTLPPGTDWVFVSSGDIDVSNITGTNVHFAFIYKSTTSEAPTWEVDNIKMSGKAITAVNEIVTRQIKLYPNPANDILNIQTEETGDISIYNIQGVEIYREVLKKQIDISSFSNGIYFVQISNTEGQTFSSRFVKQ